MSSPVTCQTDIQLSIFFGPASRAPDGLAAVLTQARRLSGGASVRSTVRFRWEAKQKLWQIRTFLTTNNKLFEAQIPPVNRQSHVSRSHRTLII